MTTTQEQTLKAIATQAQSRRDFLERFIDHAIREYGVLGGMFWDCSDPTPKPICQRYHGGNETLRLGCSAKQHTEFLHQACRSSEPLLISSKRQNDATSDSNAIFPTLLLVTVKHGGRTEVVELFFAGVVTDEKVKARIPELSAMARLAAVHGMPLNSPAPTLRAHSPQINTSETESFIHSLHQSLDLKDSARAIVNETRRFLDCDRVSVVQMQGNRSRTLAVSGQPSVNRRSNAVRLLEKVANRVLPTRQQFWYPDEESLPPQIQNPLEEYLTDAATRTMVIVPVFDRVDSTQQSVDEHRESKRLIGGIIVEHCREQWEREHKAAVVELATRHGGDAYRNAWNHQSLFLYNIWKWIGKSKIIFAARHLPKTIAAAAGLLATALILTFVQTDFQLTCDGALIPVERQLVFPQSPGIVSEVLVEHGQKVESGDTIVRITDLNLDYQLSELEGQIGEVEESVRAIQSSRLGARRGEEDKYRQENLKAQLAELASLKEQQRIYLERKEALTVTSPLSGQVMTWDVQKQLRNRPVTASDQLMEIANVDGQWSLELDLPDRKVGHFMKRWSVAKETGEPVEVEFILAAEPGVSHVGRVSAVGTSTEINAANEHHLKILVDIDIESMDVRQSRSGVSAKIGCGKASLGYAWFHPVKEFFQAKVLFPLW